MSELKNVYTVEEFTKEILRDKRHPNWVRKRCKAKVIKTVASAPYLIPMSEALRFINGGKSAA
jgi:hypothetical protein